jgi:hypothetical protein
VQTGRAGYHQASNRPPRMSIWHPGPWWGPSGPGSAPAHTWPIDAPGSASAPQAAATVLQPPATQLAAATGAATTAAPTTPPPPLPPAPPPQVLPESPHQAAIPEAGTTAKRQRTRAPKAAT